MIPKKEASSPLLSPMEFAAALRVTVACVRRWVLERKIAYVKVGRLVRIPSQEVGRLIAEGMRPAKPSRAQ
jgi:excisionase family DNA binding protein